MFWFELKRLVILVRSNVSLVLKLIIIDQLTKWWFISTLIKKPGLKIQVTGFFDFIYSWNYGVSFGLLREYYQYSNFAFLIINSIIVLYLLVLLVRSQTAISFVGYSLVIGGAIGNLIDRCVRGAVFDFIYFHYNDFGFPIFNLADSFISIGVLLLINDHFKIKKIIEQIEEDSYSDRQLEIQADAVRKRSSGETI